MNGTSDTDILKAFGEYLKVNCHCSFENRFLLTLSGGVDSTVMAWLFHETGISFAVAHCNFHLRGKESRDDQQFVEDMARKMQATCYVKHFKTKDYARANGISVQMAARNLRYEWFEFLRGTYQFEYIAIGHNCDDVVETVMLNLLRGTGIKGLTGIKPRQGFIIRPLLFASRDDILSFARKKRIRWRDDSSNAETKYLRNAIRHDIIPRLEQLHPAFRQNIIQTTSNLNQTAQLLDMTMEDIRKSICIELPDRWLIDMDKLTEYPAVETILFELLKDFGCNATMIRSLSKLIGGESGKRILTDSHTITRDRQYLIITENGDENNDSYTVGEDTTSLKQPMKLTFVKRTVSEESFVIPTARQTAALDLDRLRFPLILRRWEHGDHFRPLGMKGNKKISDFLIDQKVPLPDKKNTWVMVSDDHIVWLVGHRIDDRFKIKRNTKHILLIEKLGESDHGTV